VTRPTAAAVVLVLAAARVEAGPWAQGAGRVYAKLSYGTLRTTTLATPDGTLQDIPRFTRHDATVSLVYGIDRRLTLLVAGFAHRRSSLRDFGAESGPGDVQVGLQLQIGTRGPWAFAFRGAVQAPTGDESKGEGLLPTGSGAWEGEGALSVGRSFAAGRGWAFVELGHQVRGRQLRDGLAYGGQVGYKLHPRVFAAWNLKGLEPYHRQPGAGSVASAAGLGDGVTYVAYGPTVIVALGRGFGVQVDAEGAFHTRNLARGAAYRIGLSGSR